jgi:hypothetical protein
VTAETLLERLRSKGVAASVEGPNLILRPASVLSPEELKQAKLLKPEIMRLLAAHFLRRALWQWFELTVAEVDGVRPTLPEVETLHQEIVRLTDDTGVLSAEALTLEVARRFRSETGRCGWCGQSGHAEDCRT